MERNQRLVFSIIFVLLFYSGIYPCSPHNRLLNRFQKDKVSQPYYLQHIETILQKGVNSSAVLPDGSKPYGLLAAPDSLFNALAIVVQFSDNTSSVNAAYFDSLLFASSQGTLRDYYDEVSYGQLTILTLNLPSSIGWLTAPQTYAYYVNSQNGFGSYPQNAQKLTEDVVALANPYVDFSQYDNNSDGYVDALFIIHSGPGAEYTGSSNDIWSHKWATYSPQMVDGVFVYTYSMEPEYWENPGDMTCGVYAHEMGHSVFGLPDLYDRDGSSRGLGRWSLMAGGSWNGNLGDSPAHPDAWSRFQMGYVTPTNLTLNETNVIIPAIENDSTIFRLWTDGDIGSQYFLVENRAPIGYDAALPGFGLLTYHIDESVMTQNDNENHYLVALEQADGNYNLEFDINSGDNGDPFPGITQNRTFDYDSAPNSRDYSGVNTLVAIRNISDNGQIMTADFEIGEAVILPPDIDISANEITFTIAEGTMTDSVFTISNIAQPESQNLNWEIYEEMPGCDWLSENPTTGSIQPGNDQQVTVFVDATQLSGGNYYCNLMLSSNDPDESLLQIPVTLNVTEVNQPPLLNQIANQFVIEGDTQEVSLYAIDPDNDNLSFHVNELPLFGSLTDNGNGTGTITLMPGFDDSGIYTDIEVVVLDNGLPVLSDTVYFDITIFDRNRSPIAINDTIMLVEDSSSTIYVLENDSDPDGDQLTLLDVYSPNNGTVFVNWSESYIIYTPNNQFFGTDSLEYIIHDGKSAFDTATVYLTILSKPDLPVAVNDFLTMNEDDCQTLDVLENDYDEDEDLLSINYVNPPVNGTISLIGDSLIGYCPNTDFFGEDSFLYSITDGANGFDSARVKITINPIPDYPIAEKDSVTIREDLSVTINILENDRDPDGDQISFMGHTEPSYGNIVNVIGDSALVYQPVNDFFGTDTFYYYIEDAIGLRDTALVKVVILSENDLPNLALPDSILIYTGTCDSLNLWNFVADKETADSLLTFDFDIKPDTLYLNYHPTSGILKFCAAHAEDYQNYTLSVTVRDVDLGEMIDSMIVAIREPNQVEDDLFTGIPEKFLLKQNYPNPFNPLTKIRFSIPKKCYVKVKIYDIVGREIETLVDNSMDAGRYEIEFYAEGLPSGIYFYHIQADNFNDVKKMILLK